MSLSPSDLVFQHQSTSAAYDVPFRHVLLTLIRALVVSKVDYCTSVLTDISITSQKGSIQSILNATTGLAFSTRWSNHIAQLLKELHWLRILECHGMAPPYLTESLHLTTDVIAISNLMTG